MIVVAGKTMGCRKPVSESDGTVSDAAGEPAPASDNVDAVIHTSPSTDSLSMDRLIHEKADVLIARSTVSGIQLIQHFILVVRVITGRVMTSSIVCM